MSGAWGYNSVSDEEADLAYDEFKDSDGIESWDDEFNSRNQWYGREFCPHPDEPCIDGCHFCGARLDVNEHNHTAG